LFNRAADLGGLVNEVIPADRLPGHILRREIQEMLAAHGSLIQPRQAEINATLNLDSIMAEGFDAVLVAIGLTKTIPLPGARRPESGVIGALDFLAMIKRGQTVAGVVLVLGGGNTAIDAALAAQQAGASEVSLVYRRSLAEMPAWPHARDRAIKAGVWLLTLTAPLDYQVGSQGRLVGLRVVRTKLGPLDAKGRRAPLPIPGTEHAIPSDLVIEALGQQVDDALKLALTGVRFTDQGLIWIHSDTMETSRHGVFAAGDIVNGGTTVVQAVAEGARAARRIDTFLWAERIPIAFLWVLSFFLWLF
jgi:NADPH-dependent glutamate synthase beta subunit-like oxidoreductase